MSREIKFRVWDKTNKEMVRVTDLSWKEGLEEINTETCVHFPYEKDTCELMQFTGLLDKNGEEIYEGDVLKKVWKRRYGKRKAVEQIGWIQYWCNAQAMWVLNFKLKEISCNENIYEGRDWIPFHEYPDKTIEIIGNVHENSELLKQ